jgi:hypothetical protein
MKFFVRTASGRTRTSLARVLAFVLIGGIVHAVTFGSAHSHITARAALGAGQAITASGHTEQAVPDPVQYRNDRQECLVCLFHQQLFNSVVHTPFSVAEQVLPDAGSKGDKLLHYSSSFISTPIARLSGRAPPRA